MSEGERKTKRRGEEEGRRTEGNARREGGGRREIKERKKGSVPESFSQILAPVVTQEPCMTVRFVSTAVCLWCHTNIFRSM